MTIDLGVPPGLVLIAAGILLPLMPRPLRRALLVAAPLLALASVWGVADGPQLTAGYLGYTLIPVEGSALARLFATVFCLAALAGGLYAFARDSRTELAAALVYAGGALGVVFAGDLVTLFVFWELMAIASTVIVACGGPEARGSAMRYAIIHFVGGALLMAGAAAHIGSTGSAEFGAMEAGSVATWLILAAFLINAGAPPLSAWVADAYPSSSWTGMVFLSAFTTKTAVYTLIVGFPGEDVLIWIGVYMVLWGVIYAILETDIRRLLAYSLVSQVGYMVAATGIGTELALAGAAAHAFSHILYKALLLMAAGSVLYMTGRSRMTELGGLFRTMPVTAVAAIVGALTISALPLTSGYVTKSLITSGTGYAGLAEVWLALAAASAGAMVYVGLKFPWFTFFDRDAGLRADDPPLSMQAAMAGLVVLCLGLGIFWQPFYALVPGTGDYVPYKAVLVLQQLQILAAAALVFFIARPWLAPRRTVTLDWDWFWRRGGRALAREFQTQWLAAYGHMAEKAVAAGGQFVRALYRRHGPDGVFGRTRPSGYLALWMTGLLCASLLLAYV
jgi:multicomponent Na+:H+ antiporter subunit D